MYYQVLTSEIALRISDTLIIYMYSSIPHLTYVQGVSKVTPPL